VRIVKNPSRASCTCTYTTCIVHVTMEIYRIDVRDDNDNAIAMLNSGAGARFAHTDTDTATLVPSQ
jgi:hypothetical protein